MPWNAVSGNVFVRESEMSYVSFGYGKKALILLPGLSDGLATVEGKAKLLAPMYKLFFDRYTVYMFSRRDDLPEGYTMADMAEDQAEAMHKLGIEKAHILGVSQGGMIAQLLAARHPELVDKLVLAVTAPCVNETLRSCIERWIGFAKKGDHKALMTDTAEMSYSERKLEGYRRLYPVIGRIGRQKSYKRFIVNANAILAFDARKDLASIAAPTLIIGGAKDKIVGADAAHELKAAISGSTLRVYKHLGHAAYEEAKSFNQLVYDFLD